MNSLQVLGGASDQPASCPAPASSNRVSVECGGQTTMFYDGGCPLCRREVGHYQRLDRARRIRWINIDTEPEELERLGITQEEGMRRLHALNADGQLVTGTYAFATIWSELPYYRRIGHLVKRLRILKLLDRAYELFARWRFRRRLKDRATEHTATNNGTESYGRRPVPDSRGSARRA